jgi:hypothetical protein
MPGLEQSLKAELTKALAHRGYAGRRLLPLPKGLSIDLYVAEDGTYHVRLRRLAPKWPSESEVTTVLRMWPVESRPRMSDWPTSKGGQWTDPKTGSEYNCLSMAWTVKAEMGQKATTSRAPRRDEGDHD